jgi:long-chain acyl-CoA synthetase
MCSSGTTGVPKGVQLSHRNVLAKFNASPGLWGLRPSSVSLVAMPLFHIGAAGWALGALYHGAYVLLVRAAEPAALLELMRRDRITHAFLVPTVIARLLDITSADAACPSLETLVYGASPTDTEVLRRAMSVFGCGFILRTG